MGALVSKTHNLNIEPVHYRILKYMVIAKTKNAGWFRIFGIGIKWKHEKLGLLFSERIGKRKYIKIGSWIFGYLPYIKQKTYEHFNKIP